MYLCSLHDPSHAFTPQHANDVQCDTSCQCHVFPSVCLVGRFVFVILRSFLLSIFMRILLKFQIPHEYLKIKDWKWIKIHDLDFHDHDITKPPPPPQYIYIGVYVACIYRKENCQWHSAHTHKIRTTESDNICALIFSHDDISVFVRSIHTMQYKKRLWRFPVRKSEERKPIDFGMEMV